MLGVDDLRAQKRNPNQLSVSVSLSDPTQNAPQTQLNCLTEDISATGLKLIMSSKIAVGTKLHVEVCERRSLEQSFRFEAEVRWCREIKLVEKDAIPQYNIGIKLHKMMENTYDNWLEFINAISH